MPVRRRLSLAVVLCVSAAAALSLSTAPALAQAPPSIEEESVLNVSASSATLSARIDAGELESEYGFEYGPTSAYGQIAPVPSGSVAAEFAGGEVTAHVQGLSAHTTYHYRVVVSNSLGVVDGGDHAFQTQGGGTASALPDGREWEMVSPAQKHGALIYPIGKEGLIQAAAEGDAISYPASAPTEDAPQGYALTEQLLSTRGPDGWETRDISTPHGEPTGLTNGSEYGLFSTSLAQGIVQPRGRYEPALSTEASGQTSYLRTNYSNGNLDEPCTGSCYQPLVTGKAPYANVAPGAEFDRYSTEIEYPCNPKWSCGPQFLGATPDLSHVVLGSTEVPLTSTPEVAEAGGGQVEAGGGYLYEWSAGRLTPISVLPSGKLAGLAALGNPRGRNVKHAISSDGARVVWSTEGVEPGLYLRDTARGETIVIAREESISVGVSEGHTEPAFQTASSDGSKVFFTSNGRLTPDAGGGASNDENERDLYECEIVEVAGKLRCTLRDLTPLTPGNELAGVQGDVLGSSEDGSYVYFVANGVLAPGAAPGQCESALYSNGLAGKTCNVYVYHDGSTKLVAVVFAEDWHDWTEGTYRYSPVEQTARVAPNGQWLTFMSRRELTGYDNRDAVSGERDAEVYLYDVQSERLVCASCNPTGARPVGLVDNKNLIDGEGAWRGQWIAANIPSWTPYYEGAFGKTVYQSRFLSDSGRLFFNGDDALAPQDVNGTWDVYEYEPAGVGHCETVSATFAESSGGCVGLVSSGASPDESAFLDASESGTDVFFMTTSQLTTTDTDGALDVYDAHECSTSSPCAPAAATQPPPCDTGDACKVAPTPQPAIYGAPASATFSGAGNVVLALTTSGKPKQRRAKKTTRSARLDRALRACRGKPRQRRAACERKARARYARQARAKSTASTAGAARRVNATRGARG
jgi:hypothetical protein